MGNKGNSQKKSVSKGKKTERSEKSDSKSLGKAQKKSTWQEFKEFAMKGNIIDMAIGVVIGTAFKDVVKSLVADVIMPPIGVLTGGVDFSELSIVLKKAGKGIDAVTLNYGAFLSSLIDFFIIAIVVFLVTKKLSSVPKLVSEKVKKYVPFVESDEESST